MTDHFPDRPGPVPGLTRGPKVPRIGPAACTGCGCTEGDACLVDGVPCWWTQPTLCSRCTPQAEAA